MYFKILIVSIFVIFTNPLSAGNAYNSKRLIVKIKSDVDISTIKHIKNYKNLFSNIFVVYSASVESLYEKLASDKHIEYVERDYFGSKDKLAKVAKLQEFEFQSDLDSYFDDPKISRLWSFLEAQDNGISVVKGYLLSEGATREEIIVAVVDTGVDFTHEDLQDNIWVNSLEIADNGIDDDGNGYIDDIHGINTLIREEGIATKDIMDRHGHGTHVSGTIAAVQNNALGIAGIAKNVKIMGIRTVPNSGDELDVDVIEAFIYAAKNGAKIINCSFGKSHNEGGRALQEAIDFIGKEYGVLVVAAAGNSRDDIDVDLTYPASFDSENLLVVASNRSSGGLSYFSNFGEISVDLAAPGSGIYSLAPGNRYATMSGTSMASPAVAGVAAEVLSQNPYLTVNELKEVLMENVNIVDSYNGKMVSEGRIDLFNILKKLQQEKE